MTSNVPLALDESVPKAEAPAVSSKRKKLRIVVKKDPWKHSAPRTRKKASPTWALTAWNLLRRCDGADRIVLAFEGAEVVGFFRFCNCAWPTVAAGTWVKPSHRRRGIATKLWKRAFGPNSDVEVSAISPDGRRFVNSLAGSFFLKVSK